ncbi:MAG: hypothetical protein ACAH27_05695 [Xanthobacteraceae bacterium]
MIHDLATWQTADCTWVSKYLAHSWFECRGCWGIPRWVYRDELGIELPSYSGISGASIAIAARAQVMMRDGFAAPWVEAAGPLQPFDIVAMKDRAAIPGGFAVIPDHVGVLVPWRTGPRRVELRILHVEGSAMSQAVSMDHPSMAARIAHIRRHSTLA